jgi:hypothetical protein
MKATKSQGTRVFENLVDTVSKTFGNDNHKSNSSNKCDKSFSSPLNSKSQSSTSLDPIICTQNKNLNSTSKLSTLVFDKESGTNERKKFFSNPRTFWLFIFFISSVFSALTFVFFVPRPVFVEKFGNNKNLAKVLDFREQVSSTLTNFIDFVNFYFEKSNSEGEEETVTDAENVTTESDSEKVDPKEFYTKLQKPSKKNFFFNFAKNIFNKIMSLSTSTNQLDQTVQSLIKEARKNLPVNESRAEPVTKPEVLQEITSL